MKRAFVHADGDAKPELVIWIGNAENGVLLIFLMPTETKAPIQLFDRGAKQRYILRMPGIDVDNCLRTFAHKRIRITAKDAVRAAYLFRPIFIPPLRQK